MKQIKNQEKKQKSVKKPRRTFRQHLAAITSNKNLGMLIFKSFMMLFVPYVYLYVCGIIDKLLLQGGFAYREAYILFVFFSLMLFWLIGLVLIGISIYKWCKRDKSAKNKPAKQKPANK